MRNIIVHWLLISSIGLGLYICVSHTCVYFLATHLRFRLFFKIFSSFPTCFAMPEPDIN